MFINNNVSFGLVLFCKCVREFGKVWAFASAEFGMGGTGICPSPTDSQLKSFRDYFIDCRPNRHFVKINSYNYKYLLTS